MSKQKFPDTLFVKREVDGDETYLIPSKSLDDVDDEGEGSVDVAVYQFVSEGKVETTRKFVAKK